MGAGSAAAASRRPWAARSAPSRRPKAAAQRLWKSERAAALIGAARCVSALAPERRAAAWHRAVLARIASAASASGATTAAADDDAAGSAAGTPAAVRRRGAGADGVGDAAAVGVARELELDLGAAVEADAQPEARQLGHAGGHVEERALHLGAAALAERARPAAAAGRGA